MTEDPHAESKERHRSRASLWTLLILAAVALLLLFVPSLISLNRYKSQITRLVSNALQRPVRLSDVELRALPRPGFVITDLTVQEDPAFSAQPVLHANSVVVSIRLWGLLRGKLQISRISVDEASLNLVHTPDGRWNIENLFHTAAAEQRRSSGSAVPFPYMEATNSRINVNNGLEKLPFSLVNADASLWQEDGGTWRVRLRAQPARTDVSLDMADTGVVRLDATLHAAPSLEQMPLHLDVDWREAQLGQLSRLLLGSDEGWRGDMTGELHLDGTVASANVKSRLRAAGVHRVEFAPAAPLDFDATCNFVFYSAERAMQNMVCDSPIGNGRVRVSGDASFSGRTPDLTVALDRVPAQAGLDLLRTVRNDLDPGLQAAGVVSGKLSYRPQAVAAPVAVVGKKRNHGQQEEAAPAPLKGSITVEGLGVSGGPLTRPVRVEKLVFEPEAMNASTAPALAATLPLPAGAPAPLLVNLRLTEHGFQVGVHGSAALPRLRELAQAAGIQGVQALSQIAGEPAAIEMNAEGPWLPSILPAGAANGSMSGSVVFKEANWKAGFLATPVLLPSATLHFDNGTLNWDPVSFAFGPIKGTATFSQPACGDEPSDCPPHFTLHFARLDLATLQGALLGKREHGSLLGSLFSRFTSSSTQPWPRIEGTAQADTLAVGPFTLKSVGVDLNIVPTGAEASSIEAVALGGQVTGTASMTVDDKPQYKVDADFTNLSPAQVGELLGMRWTGGPMDGSAHVELAGYSAKDLAASATGTVHFDWRKGSLTSGGESPTPAALSQFDEWSGDAAVGHHAITLGENQVLHGKRKSSVAGAAEFGIPAVVTFGETAPHKRASE